MLLLIKMEEFKNDMVKTRLGHDYPVTEPDNVGLMDVAPIRLLIADH